MLRLQAFLFSPLYGPRLGLRTTLTLQGSLVLTSDEVCANASSLSNASGNLLIYRAPIQDGCSVAQLYDNAVAAGAVALLQVEREGDGCGRCGNGVPGLLVDTVHDHSPLPWLACEWVGGSSLQALVSGVPSNITIIDETARLLEEGWAQALLRWVPCAQYAVLAIGAATILKRRHVRSGSTFRGVGLPDVVVTLELALSIALVVGFALGPLGCIYFGAGQPAVPNAFAAAHLSPGAQAFFVGQFAGVSCAATLLVAVYYSRVYHEVAVHLEGTGRPVSAQGCGDAKGAALALFIVFMLAVFSAENTLNALIFTTPDEEVGVPSDVLAALAYIVAILFIVVNSVAAVVIFFESRRISRSLHALQQSLYEVVSVGESASSSTGNTLTASKTELSAASPEAGNDRLAISAASHRRARYLMANVVALCAAIILNFIMCNQVTLFSIYDRLSMQIVQIAMDQAYFWHNFFQVVVWEWPFSGKLPNDLAPQAWPPLQAYQADAVRRARLTAPKASKGQDGLVPEAEPHAE